MQVVIIAETPVASVEPLREALHERGIEAQVIAGPSARLDGALLGGADVILLDATLCHSRAGCLALCRRLESEVQPAAPILILGEGAEVTERLAGLMAGADDYLSRPFDPEELAARMAVLARRRRRSPEIQLRIADLEYNPALCEVRRAGRLIHLGPINRTLLQLLMSESPRVVSRDRLERVIWGERVPERDLLRSHMSLLRKAIDHEHAHKLIQTVHGTGFRLIG